MSQYLSFSLQYKEDPNIQVELGYFCTTPARRMSSEGIFPYTGGSLSFNKEEGLVEETSKNDDRPVTAKLYNEFIKWADNKLKERQKWITEYQDKKLRIESLITKSTSKEVIDRLLEEIEELDLSISEVTEDIKDYQWYKDDIEKYWSIAEENKDKWNFIYSNV